MKLKIQIFIVFSMVLLCVGIYAQSDTPDGPAYTVEQYKKATATKALWQALDLFFPVTEYGSCNLLELVQHWHNQDRKILETPVDPVDVNEKIKYYPSDGTTDPNAIPYVYFAKQQRPLHRLVLLCALKPKIDNMRGLERPQPNYQAVFEYLLQKVDLEARDEYGNTALLLAARFSSVDVARRLIAAGARVNVQVNNRLHGFGPLHYAAARGNQNLATLFLEQNGNLIHEKTGYNQDTPLHIAAQNQQATMVHFLLSKGANPDHKNNDNKKPRHVTRWFDFATQKSLKHQEEK